MYYLVQVGKLYVKYVSDNLLSLHNKEDAKHYQMDELGRTVKCITDNGLNANIIQVTISEVPIEQDKIVE